MELLRSGGFYWAFSLLIWVCCLGILGKASAQSAADQQLLQLINTGKFDAARSVLETQNPSDADRAFLLGRVMKVQRRYPEAIKAFRFTLQIDPQYIKARRELAHTLLLDRQYDVSAFHFDTLLSIDPNTGMHDGYRRFLRVIDQNKPIGVSGYFSLIPSTNINRGTSNSAFDTDGGTFVIDAESKAQSGIGAQLGLNGFFRHSLGPTSRVSLNWGIFGTHYKDTEHDNATGSASLIYERSFSAGRWSVGPYYSKTWRGDDADHDIFGLRFGVARRLSDKNQLVFSANHESRNYPNQSYKDGNYYAASLTLAHQVNPSLSFSGGLGVEHSNPEAQHLQYRGYKVFSMVSKAWEGGLNTSFGIEVGSREFIGTYPLTTSARDDEFYGLNFSIQHTRIQVKGFTPRLSCSYIRTLSNVAFYDYDVTECRSTISKKF